MGAATKRRFIGLSFFPYGGDISNTLGLAGMSPDVEHMEQRAAQDNYGNMMGTDQARERLDAVLKLADWYVEANSAVTENNLPPSSRTPQEHLVCFFMACDHLIRTEVQPV